MANMKHLRFGLKCANCGKKSEFHRAIDAACPFGRKDRYGSYPGFLDTVFKEIRGPYKKKATP